MKEKILSLPNPFGGNLEIYKNIWGKSTEPLSIVSGLQGDHLNGMFLNCHLTQFLDSVVEGINPNYTLIGQVQIFPVVNANAAQSGSRLWPLDGMDMDLAFPGSPTGETSEAIASAILQNTKDSYWGLILTSASPHYEDATHAQIYKSNSTTKKLCRDLQIKIARQQKKSSTQMVNLFHHWQEQETSSVMISLGSPRTINSKQCDILFQGIINFMKEEGILKDYRDKKSGYKTKTLFYKSNDEISVQTNSAGIFLKEVQVGSHGEVFDQVDRAKSHSLSHVQDHERMRRLQLGHEEDNSLEVPLNHFPSRVARFWGWSNKTRLCQCSVNRLHKRLPRCPKPHLDVRKVVSTLSMIVNLKAQCEQVFE